MLTSDEGIRLIKQFESLALTAYPDPGTGGDPWTIGWGTTRYPDGNAIRPGDTITTERAEQCLRHDLLTFEEGVAKAVTFRPLAQHQFDALVSLAYNIGLRNFRESTLVRLCNRGDFVGAAAQFARWNKAAGKVLKGLTRRREAEATLFKGAS